MAAAGEAGGGISWDGTDVRWDAVDGRQQVVAPPADGGISGGIYNELSKKFFYEYSNIDFSNRIVFGIRIFE